MEIAHLVPFGERPRSWWLGGGSLRPRRKRRRSRRGPGPGGLRPPRPPRGAPGGGELPGGATTRGSSTWPAWRSTCQAIPRVLSPADVQARIAAFLKGEGEPGRRCGLALSASRAARKPQLLPRQENSPEEAGSSGPGGPDPGTAPSRSRAGKGTGGQRAARGLRTRRGDGFVRRGGFSPGSGKPCPLAPREQAVPPGAPSPAPRPASRPPRPLPRL